MTRETNKNREHREEGKPRRFNFSLSVAGMVSLAVVGVAALAWVFILGVLVGRGYQPEQAVPQLAEIMPRPGENATAQPPVQGVLRPDELNFFDAVKEKTGAGAAFKTKADPEAAPAPAPAATTQPRPAAPSTSGVKQFRYVYQVAALKNPDMAEGFAARLKKQGFATSIEKAEAGGGTWHRVLIYHTGTPESTHAVKEALKDLGVEKPIMKAKTPFTAPNQ